MTDDRIGRSMKKCVNMACATSWRCRAPWPRGRRRRCSAARRHDGHRLARHDFQHAVDDDAVARVKSRQDHDVLVAVVVADDDGPDLRDVLFIRRRRRDGRCCPAARRAAARRSHSALSPP